MAFNYTVNFYDPLAPIDPQDAIVQQAMNAALAGWSQYLNGTGTLKVQLNVEPLGAPSATAAYELAEAGPTATVADGTTPDGHALRQTAAINALATGNHVAASDITVTFNQQLLSQIASVSSAYPLVTIFEHELLHGFGISGYRSVTGLLGYQESTFDAKSMVTGSGLDFFTGAVADSVYGGAVPLTTGVGVGSDYYHVGATGTGFDPAVLRSDLIYPYSLPGQAITGLDVGILDDLGAPISAAGFALIDPTPTGTETVLNAAQLYAAVTDPTVGGTTQPGETVTVTTASGAVVGTTVASGTGAWSVRPAGLQDGVQALTAYVNGQRIAATPLNLADGAQVAALYMQILGRPVDAASLPGARQQLYNGQSVASYAAGLATSAEASGDLAALWMDVVGRAITPGELSGAQTALGSGASQANLRTALASSTEAANAVAGVFQGAVARAPTATELPGAQAALANGASLASLRGALADSGEASGKLQALYPAVLGRSVTTAELAGTERALASGSTLAGLQAALATSNEERGELSTLRLAVVGRPITAGEVSGAAIALENGATQADLRKALASSTEAGNAVGGVFQAAVGRAPTAAELPGAQAALVGGTSLANLRGALAGSAEASVKLQALYPAVLGRPVTGPELAGDAQALASGSTLAGLRAALATSDEAARAVDSLYLTTVGRYPVQSTGVPAVEQALASGSSLAEQRQMLATGGEGTTVLTSLFQTVLGRNPTGTELPAAEQAVASGGTLQGTKASLVASPEFVTRVNAAFQDALGRPANAVEIAADQSDLSAVPAPQDPNYGLAGYQMVPVTPVTIAGSGPNLVYGLLNGGLANGLTFADAVVSAQPLTVMGAPMANAFNHDAVPSLAGDIIGGFNPQTDYIQVEASQASSFGAITLTAYFGGTLASFGSNSTIELSGLAPSALTPANFRFV